MVQVSRAEPTFPLEVCSNPATFTCLKEKNKKKKQNAVTLKILNGSSCPEKAIIAYSDKKVYPDGVYDFFEPIGTSFGETEKIIHVRRLLVRQQVFVSNANAPSLFLVNLRWERLIWDV